LLPLICSTSHIPLSTFHVPLTVGGGRDSVVPRHGEHQEPPNIF
jgi:hypothetical protein